MNWWEGEEDTGILVRHHQCGSTGHGGPGGWQQAASISSSTGVSKGMAGRPETFETAVFKYSSEQRRESQPNKLLLPSLDLTSLILVVVPCWSQDVTLSQILLHTELYNELIGHCSGSCHWQKNSSGWSQDKPVLSDSHHEAGTQKDYFAKCYHLRIQALTPPQCQTQLEMVPRPYEKQILISQPHLKPL